MSEKIEIVEQDDTSKQTKETFSLEEDSLLKKIKKQSRDLFYTYLISYGIATGSIFGASLIATFLMAMVVNNARFRVGSSDSLFFTEYSFGSKHIRYIPPQFRGMCRLEPTALGWSMPVIVATALSIILAIVLLSIYFCHNRYNKQKLTRENLNTVLL
jgi:hypothetical protein